MTKQILVPFGKTDSVEDIIPYLKGIAQHGTRVVFLAAYPYDDFSNLLAWMDTMETGIRTRLALAKVAHKFGWGEQRRMASEKVAPVVEILRHRAVEVKLHLYTGSLRKIVDAYASEGDVRLVVTNYRAQLAITEGLYRLKDLFRSFKHHAISRVIIVHPASSSGQPHV